MLPTNMTSRNDVHPIYKEKVHVGNDQEKAQSERHSHSKTRDFFSCKNVKNALKNCDIFV